MPVRKKEDLVVGNNYYLAIVQGEEYADKVKLEKIEHPKKHPFLIKVKQTRITVVSAKKEKMVLDLRQIGIGETKKEANKNFLML